MNGNAIDNHVLRCAITLYLFYGIASRIFIPPPPTRPLPVPPPIIIAKLPVDVKKVVSDC